METQNKFTPQNLDYILSIDSDRWLFHADVLVDKAHVVMLEERDIISREQSRDILNGLIAIEQRGAATRICSMHNQLHLHIIYLHIPMRSHATLRGS